MNSRQANVVLFALALGMSLASLASAQQHEPDPKAVKAFESLIKSYRTRPALTVRTTVTVEIEQGGTSSQGQEVSAELTMSKDRKGIFKLRGFECYIQDGTVNAIHAETDNAYFSMPDDGSPYYTLMNMFLDIPFPHLAIAFGEESIEDICMQFHPKAPWILPTGVREETKDGQTRQIISLTSDDASMDISIDPETMLIQSLDLEITGGYLVQAGATMRYHHEFEYEIHDQPLDDATFAFDPGERQLVDMLASLRPEPKNPQGGGHPVGDLIGKEAPGFILETLDGRVIDLADLRDQVVVLDFWATWCGPCLQGLPKLHEVASWVKDGQLPVTILTINLFEGNTLPQDTPEARKESAARLWKQKQFSLPVLMDYSDETGRAYGVNSIPNTIIIRSDGIVADQHIGLSPNYIEDLKSSITEAIEALAADD